jgi:hypothetical protein
MTDPEREHFVRQVRDLERRLRHWRLMCFALLVLLLLPPLLGGLLGRLWIPRLERERVQFNKVRAQATDLRVQIASYRESRDGWEKWAHVQTGHLSDAEEKLEDAQDALKAYEALKVYNSLSARAEKERRALAGPGYGND